MELSRKRKYISQHKPMRFCMGCGEQLKEEDTYCPKCRKPVDEKMISESVPKPVPEPIPEPIPEPVPEPIPEPVPETTSESIPESIPEPIPESGPKLDSKSTTQSSSASNNRKSENKGNPYQFNFRMEFLKYMELLLELCMHILL